MILAGIAVLFFILLFIKSLLNYKLQEKFCVICTAVTLTWFVLLILYWLNIFKNPVIIALLIGQTILAIYYILDKNEGLNFFRLPFLLSLIFVAYSLIRIPDEVNSIGLLAVLWTLFILIYFYRNNKNLNSFVNKIIECCKRW